MYLCRKCGASHGMVIETMATGHMEPLDICKDCLFAPWEIKFDPHIDLTFLDNFIDYFGELRDKERLLQKET